jgi:hypothetical protein
MGKELIAEGLGWTKVTFCACAAARNEKAGAASTAAAPARTVRRPNACRVDLLMTFLSFNSLLLFVGRAGRIRLGVSHAARPGACAVAKPLESFPMPSISHSTTSPCYKKQGGFIA